MTLHRPSKVDNRNALSEIFSAVSALSKDVPIIFPCHPRTRKMIEAFKLTDLFSELPESGLLDSGIYLLPPLGYDEFLYLWKDSALVLTDSGGLQEETSALKIPCITLRENTERPITVTEGSNELAGTDFEKILMLGKKALSGNWKEGRIPQLWDGRASERIVKVINKLTVEKEELLYTADSVVV
ncbi:MAG: UDP-N-acetyl glucosamine 2-epimerase [Fibrobacter sp.]|jgi:UDP-N-acetylglucosamine 2-epimerase (non-hydrolysing)|nr:UDP-N-acetyl glucosamine 2-epimerase [Fibrobacter sp.]